MNGVTHQISIMVMPGLIQLMTYFLTCRWASAACLKSFHISSLAWSKNFFSSLVIRDAAERLCEIKHIHYDVLKCF